MTSVVPTIGIKRAPLDMTVVGHDAKRLKVNNLALQIFHRESRGPAGIQWDYPCWSQRGNGFIQTQEYPDALRCWEMAYAGAQNHPADRNEAVTKILMLLFTLGNYRELTIRLRELFARGHLSQFRFNLFLACCYLKTEKIDAALDLFETVKNQMFGFVASSISEEFEQAKIFVKNFVPHVEDSINENTDSSLNVHLLMLLFDLQLITGDFTGALEISEELKEENPDLGSLIYANWALNYGHTYDDGIRMDEGLSILVDIFEHAEVSYQPKLLFASAFFLFEIGRYTESLNFCNWALETMNDHVVYPGDHLMICVLQYECLKQLDQHEEASVLLNKIKELESVTPH